MEIIKPAKFLEWFPNHVFRFLDQTGEGRPAVLSREYRKDLNQAGYCAYFTVNGFKNFEEDKECKIEHLTSLHAFFIDIDGRKDQEELDRIKDKLNPTFIVETMRGYHVYWMLDEGIYKEDNAESWNVTLSQWTIIEANIVKTLKGDPQVKDAPRILRVPGTFYWKKTGSDYKEGTEKSPFKIKITYSDVSARYSMSQMLEAFPSETDTSSQDIAKKKSDAEKADFFRRVDEKYKIEDRPSFKALISGSGSSLPDGASRNQALLITSCLARRAGWTEKQVLDRVVESGWHGMVAERGGMQEIKTTIFSGFRGGYVFGTTHPIIEFNTTDVERQKMNDTYIAVMRDRKEKDKIRFSTYEHELFARYPNIKKNEVGILFNYDNGVYRMMSRDDQNKLVLDALYEDLMWGYRTSRYVSDKIMCLSSIVPLMKETYDEGKIINVKNGLVDIITGELKPHTPEFVSMVQFPVEYDKEADCPNWKEAMKAWVAGSESQEKGIILQKYAGYCLSSSTHFAKALFLIGDGGNGKSTFADTIAMMIGDKATSRISLEDIYADFGMAGLIGKRLNIIEEISGNFFHSHKIKALISGEEITVNMKYRDSFKFKPGAKFIFAVNQMPRVDDASSGTERRILIINFKNNFRDNPDTALRFQEGTLAKELSGILNWAIKGAQKLAKEGFEETEERKLAIGEYRKENSSVDGFLSECTEPTEGSTMSVKDVYVLYRNFCKLDGRIAKSRIGFLKEVKMYSHKTGHFTVHERESSRHETRIEGIRILPEWNMANSYEPYGDIDKF